MCAAAGAGTLSGLLVVIDSSQAAARARCFRQCGEVGA
jgi:hypothetical protein